MSNKQPYYTGRSPRQRQNDSVRFYWHRNFIVCRFCPRNVQAEMTLDPSYPCDWHTKGGRKLCKSRCHSSWGQGLSLPTSHDSASLKAMWVAAFGKPLLIEPSSGSGTMNSPGGVRARHHRCYVEKLMLPKNAVRSPCFTFKLVNMCVWLLMTSAAPSLQQLVAMMAKACFSSVVKCQVKQKWFNSSLPFPFHISCPMLGNRAPRYL